MFIALVLKYMYMKQCKVKTQVHDCKQQVAKTMMITHLCPCGTSDLWTVCREKKHDFTSIYYSTGTADVIENCTMGTQSSGTSKLSGWHKILKTWCQVLSHGQKEPVSGYSTREIRLMFITLPRELQCLHFASSHPHCNTSKDKRCCTTNTITTGIYMHNIIIMPSRRMPLWSGVRKTTQACIDMHKHDVSPHGIHDVNVDVEPRSDISSKQRRRQKKQQ